jgi:DNA-binding IclR family transcriptional regulator
MQLRSCSVKGVTPVPADLDSSAPAAAGVEAASRRRRDGVQVIARAAEVLRQLAAEPHGLTLLELSTRVNLPRSTTHRIVGALSREGLVTTGSDGKLCIGPALIGIAVASRRDVRLEAGPYLERLSRELRETVNLAVLDGGEVLFIDQYTSRRYLRIASEIGARFPVYCTANGKALLAALPPAEVARHLPAQLSALTKNTNTNRRKLLAELAEVRGTGVAFDREEHAVGVSAVATAVRDAVGAIAAITVVMPSARFHGREEQVTAALLRTRDEIQVVLHGD